MDLLRKYAPVVDQYSIDEAFCDMTGTRSLYGDPIEFAYKLKDEIYETLGFSVNVGISSNKLLAKMASDFEKPNKVHTLFPEEVPEKMWPLPVGDLFLVGKSTGESLRQIGIKTIFELAHTDEDLLVVTLIGFRLAGQKPDRHHPFGHGRIEYLSGLAVSVVILLMGFELGKTSFEKILSPAPVEFSLLPIIILPVSILVKGWMYLFNRKLGKKLDSAAMMATAADSLSDMISTGVVLLGSLIGHFFQIQLDGVPHTFRNQ